MERWKMEEWKEGRMEEWKEKEEWKVEGWNDGRMEEWMRLPNSPFLYLYACKIHDGV